MELSVIVPVYNEADNIAPLLGRLIPVLEGLGLPASRTSGHASWEIIFVNDGSRDATLARIQEAHQKEPRVGVIAFSRNFGKEVAIAAGLDYARGRGVVIMDADLQHPPETIAEFVAKWREGFVMVYAQRTDRVNETAIKRGFARLFYRLFRAFGEMPLPEGAGDFRLIDRRGVDALRAMGERARFSKGLYAWVGFSSVGVPFVVADRAHGVTKWSFRKLFRFAFDGITSFSTIPLKIWTYAGLAISLASIATALYFLIRTMLLGSDLPGYPSLIVSVMFFSGIQLMSLGMIGEYVGRIFAEVKRRPLYIVAESLVPAGGTEGAEAAPSAGSSTASAGAPATL
ncbi:glycosyltransferase family 2 protein [Chelatococcus asaccharovorans]|uniref:glycosyltransferase family 2 protein n=1 Tax=Chelatococcus asaccharovorans TaxID=28210 RepID=UPI00224C7629|nr:glycosyltransferase family 2 protein [Chelatococcus asaccharovorans]CAH1670913.1 Glycosyltransferase involved in cell wall biosynthesis [Chelatococcus asaccharovorans]CAH1677637.1 Glycosyltransferase involved in cell wall biosynthesis [Chelatococcus asaccharovorans]